MWDYIYGTNSTHLLLKASYTTLWIICTSSLIKACVWNIVLTKYYFHILQRSLIHFGICAVTSNILCIQTLKYMWTECCRDVQNVDEVWARFVTPWMLLLLLFVCFRLSWLCLVPLVMWFSTSEMCVSWGGASVGGCSACLPVPHSSSATSHSHRFRGEGSTHTSPAHSDPVVHSPRRSELLTQMRTSVTL